MTDAVRPRSTAPSDLAPVDTGDAPTIDGREVRGGSAWDVLGAGLRGSARVAAALASAQEAGTRQEWLVVVGECQGLVNSLTALQDVALAEVARRESDWGEDGSLGETVHGHGRVALDAADLAAPALGASHVQAQRRLEQAVRLGAGRVPEDVDSPVAPEQSGLGALHTAMATGRLDGYRAGVVAAELELAPADVAEAVVAALEPHLDDEGPVLRRRCRRLLARISPELLRQRALRARAETGLRRWVAEPGVDAWYGTFPSEDAALAWAAVDRLAHDLVAAGTCTSVEHARGKALTDLVTGNATIDVQVVLTVPADACSSDAAVPPQPTTGEPMGGTTNSGMPRYTANARTNGAMRTLKPTAPVEGDPAVVAREDGAPDEQGPRPGPVGTDDGFVQVQGARASEPLLVRRDWLDDRLRGAGSLVRPGPETCERGDKPPPVAGSGGRFETGVLAATTSMAGLVFASCAPLTGARIDPGDGLTTDAYRPGVELAALVRARDGRCRFPGCSVAARFCDLDHVRPWPIGSTSGSNLLCLCRRHHRIKQRPGWRVHLAPDGTATWTDASGRARTTEPLDALDALVLTVDAAGPRARPPAPRPTPRTHGPPWSALETHHEFWVEHRGSHEPPAGPAHRRCTSSAQLRAGLAARRRARAPLSDVPPF